MSARRKKIEKPGFAESLDTAAMGRFDFAKVETHYSIFSMRYVTSWTDHEGKNLTPAKARLVREFVAGFSAAWDRIP